MNWHQLMEKALAELKSSGAEACEPLLLKAMEQAEKAEYRAMTHFNLGLVYYDLKRPKEAEQSFAQAIEIIQECLPLQNELYGMFIKTMIEFYEKEGRWSDSKKYFLLEIEHTANMFGARHPYVANMICELADVLIKTGDHAGAEKKLNQALEIMTGAKGPDHLSNGPIHANLALCYGKLGRIEDASYHKGRAEAIEARRARRKGGASGQKSEPDEIVEQSLD